MNRLGSSQPGVQSRDEGAISRKPGDRQVEVSEFARVEVAQSQVKDASSLPGLGLTPPQLKISFFIQPQGQEGALRVLQVGGAASPREVWATTPEARVVGRLFDPPLRALRDFLTEHAPRSPQGPPKPLSLPQPPTKGR